MSNYNSSGAVHAVCDEFIRRAEPEGIPANVPIAFETRELSYRRTPRRAVRGQDPQPAFAPLAIGFIRGLVSESAEDLCTDWLLHRLHSVLVEQQPLKPGEIEVLHADISARVALSSLSETEKRLLTEGVEKILMSLKARPLPAARPRPTDAAFAKR